MNKIFLRLCDSCFKGKASIIMYMIMFTVLTTAFLTAFLKSQVMEKRAVPVLLITVYLFFTLILLVASGADFLKRIIPNSLIITGLSGISLLRIIYLIINADHGCKSILSLSLIEAITGMAVGMLPLIALNAASHMFSGKGFGGGDIKLMALGGFSLGWKAAAAAFVYICFATLVIIPVLLISGKIKRKDFVPFGPFISFSLYAALIMGAGQS